MNVIIMFRDELEAMSFFVSKGSRKDNDCIKVSYKILFNQATHIIKRYHVFLLVQKRNIDRVALIKQM